MLWCDVMWCDTGDDDDDDDERMCEIVWDGIILQKPYDTIS